MDHWDVIVVGAGHAGCEAALAAARLGSRTLLVTLRLSGVAEMSCNPAIGGLAKGQIVREIDALGGEMAQVADATGIQFRLLNRSRGAAVRAPRAQCDKDLYSAEMRRRIETQDRLDLVEDEVLAVRLKGQRILGVQLRHGGDCRASAVVLTTGTFLRGLMHTGDRQTPGGRVGDRASDALSESLRTAGLELGRLKTGTPARLDRDTIDFSVMERQPGDEDPQPFSFATVSLDRPQVDCWITRTDSRIHEIIRANTHRAPLFTGQIAGVGPRYCPSIEDKVVRFADKDSHQVFMEPEGLETPSIYPNGISTSLPADVQDEIIRRLPGCAEARVLRYGYAVEYDFAPARQLRGTLESRSIHGLYLAGQINGTSGYEEAAAQGVVAGVNAVRALNGQEPWIPDRATSYIGVMVDDLITKDIREPYRMFTSRSEYRLLLRQDNAPYRLAAEAEAIGLHAAHRLAEVRNERERIAAAIELLQNNWYEGKTWARLLCQPQRTFADVAAAFVPLAEMGLNAREAEQVEIELHYAGYIKRLESQLVRYRRAERIAIPAAMEFRGLPGLKREAAETLARFRPRTLGQAQRLAGITPADIAMLDIHLRKAVQQK